LICYESLFFSKSLFILFYFIFRCIRKKDQIRKDESESNVQNIK